MRILGIDPGSRITGCGVIEIDGQRARLIHQFVIRTSQGEFPARLADIFEGVRRLIDEHHPDEAAIESVFISRNASSALKLGQARGAAICAAVSMGIGVSEYSPRSVKQAIVGRGGAEKVQVQHMVGVLLRIEQQLAEDAADALAVALCHQHTRETLLRMQGAAQ